jgi:hypothetical protein
VDIFVSFQERGWLDPLLTPQAPSAAAEEAVAAATLSAVWGMLGIEALFDDPFDRVCVVQQPSDSGPNHGPAFVARHLEHCPGSIAELCPPMRRWRRRSWRWVSTAPASMLRGATPGSTPCSTRPPRHRCRTSSRRPPRRRTTASCTSPGHRVPTPSRWRRSMSARAPPSPPLRPPAP